jgi:hypothetical protein
MGQNFSRHYLIDENPAMLRVILELDDVAVTVVGFQQMRLGAPSHFPDEAARVYGHDRVPDNGMQRAKLITEENMA